MIIYYTFTAEPGDEIILKIGQQLSQRYGQE